MGSSHSMNEGIGKEFYRKGNSVKRFRPFSESPDSKKLKYSALIPFPDLPFLASLGHSKENHPKKQGFFLSSEPLKSLRKKGKNAQKAWPRPTRSGDTSSPRQSPDKIVFVYVLFLVRSVKELFELLVCNLSLEKGGSCKNRGKSCIIHIKPPT